MEWVIMAGMAAFMLMLYYWKEVEPILLAIWNAADETHREITRQNWAHEQMMKADDAVFAREMEEQRQRIEQTNARARAAIADGLRLQKATTAEQEEALAEECLRIIAESVVGSHQPYATMRPLPRPVRVEVGGVTLYPN